MIPVTIEKQIAIAAKAATVWRFVGTEAGLRQWWGLDIALEAKAGGRCEERGHWQGRAYCLRGTVTTYQPPHQLTLVLHNTDESKPWPAWVTISICLTESDAQTQVTLVHQAFDAITSGLEPAYPVPLATATPHAIWNMHSPQNQLGLPPTPHRRSNGVASLLTSATTDAWLAQQETRWQACLHGLADQVQLVEIG